MMHHEAHKYKNLAVDSEVFALTMGGLYQVAAVSADWSGPGSVTLEQLGTDGSTFLSITTPLAANGGAQYYLPPGSYKFAVSSVTADVSVVRIPVC